MSSYGWIPLYRQIKGHSIWQDKPFSKGQAWIDLLLRASYEKKKMIIGNKVVEIQPGEFITSNKKLMDAWGWGKEKTRSFLKTLELDTMIRIIPDRKWTVISIVNWGKYQIVQTDDQTDSRPLSDRCQTDSRPLSDPINNINNKINKKEFYGNNYSSMDVVVGSEAPHPTPEQIGQIVKAWNEIPHTVKIKDIIPMTSRYEKLRVVLSMVGMEGVMKAIQSVKESEYLSQRGHVVFDRYFNRNAVQGLLEGAYQENYRKEAAHGSFWDWKPSDDGEC